ncbi:hypothetical protein [Sporosarcina sp. JAI121]|uniref:hypothetical protein n=1 Tax=Sporosarcina sp. JAI121 TaxID=2723064 RepID=UPI0015CAAEFB|nr:hypothetical protein [Sporosarcina sp. JAI121]NYF23621.1 hypothetical protein [Sporosarcina sp. JAI121]
MKKLYIYSTVVALFCMGLFQTNLASASAPVSGTFVDVAYDEVQLGKNVTEKRLKSITIKNAQGRTTTLNIDKFAKLSVDSVSTTIDAFKLGMEVEADVELRRVKALRGMTGTEPAKIEHRDKVVTGTVNKVDKNGKFLSIRLDTGQSKTYYINDATDVIKGTALTDLSVMYEGDRVKLIFSEYDTNFIDSIEVIVQGIQVEALYKGTIQRIEPTTNKLHIKDERMFRDWKWQPVAPKSTSSYTYSAKIPIYVGNEKIKSDRLRYYANHDVYFVTVSQFGKEVIERMVIKKTNERTFYEPMKFVNTAAKMIGLQNSGSFRYHDGTILIRNGRLVVSNSLQSSGTAFVVTDGKQNSQYANVVHITNDGFASPNLTSHAIYFGQISSGHSYKVTLKNASLLSNNYWRTITAPKFAFSNDTVAIEDFGGSVIKIVPQQDEMRHHAGRWGYFYVANQTIVAAHLIDPKAPTANLVSVGRIEAINPYKPSVISIRNVSQWMNGYWNTAGNISSMNIEQATIIRDGKVIKACDLQPGERVYVLHESKVKGRVLLVD